MTEWQLLFYEVIKTYSYQYPTELIPALLVSYSVFTCQYLEVGVKWVSYRATLSLNNGFLKTYSQLWLWLWTS